MTSTALDFLDSAKRLLDQPNPAEIACRNAVSRAYYAVYHHALSHADTQDWACYEMPAHQGLAERYAANQHKALAYQLTDLHKSRCAADYQLNYTYSQSNAVEHLAKCEKWIERTA
jgi:hypothetical protein